jgi:hypothetical protein
MVRLVYLPDQLTFVITVIQKLNFGETITAIPMLYLKISTLLLLV